MTIKRKYLEPYGSTIIMPISDMRRRKQPLDLYVPILSAQSLITILTILLKEIPFIMS